MIPGLAAALLAALLFGLGAVAQAHGVRRLGPRAHRLTTFVRAGVRDRWVMLVVAAYVLGFFLHAVSIWLLPLYLAQATVSLSIPVTAVTSLRLLHEPLGGSGWAAVGAVTGGLGLLALGAGAPGEVRPSAALAVSLWSACVLLAAAGALLPGAGGGRLGALSGLGYAGTAVAVRGTGLPVTGVTVATALAIPVLATVAFWLYSRALDRSAATAATAALIVCQTFVPALVGVLLLGDRVRGGWWPAVVLGLALSVAGAAALARRGVRSPAAPVTGSAPGPAH